MGLKNQGGTKIRALLHHQFIQRRHGVVVLGREFFYYTIALFFSVRMDGWMTWLPIIGCHRESFHIILFTTRFPKRGRGTFELLYGCLRRL